VGRAGDREVIISADAGKTVRVWDAEPVDQPLTGHTGLVKAVTGGRVGDREVIVSGGDDATVRVWDAVTGQPVGQPLTGHTSWVLAVALGRGPGCDRLRWLR